LKNQIKLIACLVVAALILSYLSLPAHAEKDTAKRLAATAGQQSADSRIGPQDGPVTGQRVQTRANDPELSRHFRNYDLIRMNPDLAAAAVKSNGRLSLKTSRRDFEMNFVPNDMRAPDYTAQEIGPDGIAHKLPRTAVNTFKGSVKGDPRAQARMAVTSKGLEGAIISEGDQFYIQPARGLSRNARADEFVFYSADDVAETDASCGVTLAEEVAAREELTREQHKGELTAEYSNPITSLSPMKVLRLATDADGEYVAAAGSSQNALDKINLILNMVERIYELEIGVTFEIGFQNTFSDATTDPYDRTSAGGTPGQSNGLLHQFRDYWNANFPASNPQYSRQLAHLWTGKDLDGSTIGIAFTGVVCRSATSSYGLSQLFPAGGVVDARSAILTAHEIGHNFSAAHTNQATFDVPFDFTQSCRNSVMEAALGQSTSSSFCTFSRSQIVGHANAQGSCLTVGGAPPVNNCNEVSIDGSLTANGTLSNSDCRSTHRGAEFFADQFSFSALAGQRVSLTVMQDASTPGLDPYVYLIGPDGSVVGQDDDGAGGQSSRIPGSESTTLPLSGKYVVEVTSFDRLQTGNYTVTVTQSGCTLTVNPSKTHFDAAGGSGTVTVSATGSGSCLSYQFTIRPNTAGWLSPQISGGFGSQVLPFTVQPNSSTAGRRAFLLVAPSIDDFLEGGLNIPITQSGTGPDCSVAPISFGQTINGNIANSDCESPIRGGGGPRADRYTFTASKGTQISITAASSQIDTFVILVGPNGVVILNDDDSGGPFDDTNSRIPGGTGMFSLPLDGTYTIEVSPFGPFPSPTGAYTLSLAGTGGDWQPTVLSSNQVELRSWTFEGRTYVYTKLTFPDAGFRVANWGTPVRTGNDFTADAVVERFNGVSAQVITNTAQIYDLGTLTNGAYTFTFKNSGTNVKTLNFSVDGAVVPNPIDGAQEFVRWQYKDFLRREPDGPGGAFWTSQITQCSTPAGRQPGETEPQCVERERAHVSAAFFLSPEFQNTGYFVLRVYRGSLGRMPHFGGSNPPDPAKDEFTRDAATVGAGIVVNDHLDPAVINANKQAFVNAFVTRAEFRAIYDSLNNTEYVDKLFQTTGVTPSFSDRKALIDGLTNSSETRASVLFKVVDGTTTITDGALVFNTTYGHAFYDNLFNPAFVQMEYFGYLLRDPDDGGYAFWLGKLNQFGNWVDAQMVLSFIKSPEYRSRFGQP